MKKGESHPGYAIFGPFRKGQGIFKSFRNMRRSRIFMELTSFRPGWQRRLSRAIDKRCPLRS